MVTCDQNDDFVSKQVGGEYSGGVTCPNITRFCFFHQESPCQNDCSQRGTCINGVCHCDYGHVGLDCS